MVYSSNAYRKSQKVQANADLKALSGTVALACDKRYTEVHFYTDRIEFVNEAEASVFSELTI